MAHYRRRIASPGILLAVLFFGLTALLLPNPARADVFDTSVDTTAGFATNAGADCPIPSSTPTASVLSCTDATGDSQQAHAAAAPGVLGAFASVTAIPCDSSNRCGANVSAHADESSSELFFNSNRNGVLNLTNLGTGFKFNSSATASPHGGAGVEAQAFVNGQLATLCTDDDTKGQDCEFSPVTVPLNTALSVFLSLDAFAEANAGFSQQSQFGLADASHTFGFVPGGKVFDLPEGVTANDPELFIFNNVFLPPDFNAVPEPASALILLVGLAGLGIMRRRPSRHASAT